MGTAPLALFWPQRQVNGTGLEYPVAEGAGKWIEFHNQPRDGAWSVGRGHEGATAREGGAGTLVPWSNAYDGDAEAVRSRRTGRESGDEDEMTV
jgi:hypothetical protein